MKSIKISAILLGCLVDIGGSTVVGIITGIIIGATSNLPGNSPEVILQIHQQWYFSFTGILFSLFFGLAFTFLGGYITARVSKIENLINSAFVGSIGILAGLLFMNKSPMILNILSITTVIPVSILGGYCHVKKWKFF